MYWAYDVVANYESAKPTPASLVKDMVGKRIKRNGDVIGASLYGRWVWFEEGKKHYTEEERKHVEDWSQE